MQKVPQHKTIDIFTKTKNHQTMITTTNHTAAKLRLIELKRQIAELDRKEETAEMLSVVTLVVGFVFIIISMI